VTQAFAGRLFGPGLPGGGVEATARWRDDGGLTVSHAGQELAAQGLAIAAGGFNAAQLRLCWEDAAGGHAFVIETEAARAACLAGAPEQHAERLAAAAGRRVRVERRFRLGWAALLLLLLLPVLALGVFFLKADALADWVVRRIPYEQEARLGELALAQTRLQMQLAESGPAVEAVRAIGEPLTAGSAHRYRWLVADHPAVNAFAAPGGVVVVHAGLIRSADSPEELAGVLAHEIAHAELRHSLKNIVKGLGMRALIALALGDYSGTALAEAAQNLTQLGFSREAEREADREGLRRLVAAGIDPGGMVRFFEKLASESKGAPPELLSTHPATEERLDELRREVADLTGNWRLLSIDLATAKASLPAASP
jgi:Zn-dependent protease with chaperone function